MHARRISGLHKRASVLPGMHSSRRDASVAEEEEIIKRPNPVTLPDSLETVEHWLVETDTNIAELIRNNVNEVEEYQALLAPIVRTHQKIFHEDMLKKKRKFQS